MKFLLSILAICAVTSGSAFAGLTVSVTNSSGEPVRDVVVMFSGQGEAPVAEDFDWDISMEQIDMQFTPYILIAPVGSEVHFPNRDRVRHHVYSFSKGNRFELKLYGKEETRTHTLENTGIVAIGCNIHDDMIGYIRVVDTAFAAKTDEAGEVTFDTPPASASALTLWHPDAATRSDMTLQWDGQAETLSAIMDLTRPGPQMAHH